MAIAERARVLITVKASPEPSEKYGDTVCVAGVRLDAGPPSWIRLYPVPLRWMASDQQFHKYEIINVDLLPAVNDKRQESYRIVIESVEREASVLRGTRARGAILEPLVGPTMCELRAGVVDNPNATSLGLVRPKKVKSVKVFRAPGWTPAQQAKIDQALRREALFGEATPPELKAPRFIAKYHYDCESPGCPGHEQGSWTGSSQAFSDISTAMTTQRQWRRSVPSSMTICVRKPNGLTFLLATSPTRRNAGTSAFSGCTARQNYPTTARCSISGFRRRSGYQASEAPRR